MGNKHNTLNSNRKDMFKRVLMIALVMAMFAALSMTSIVPMAFAQSGTAAKMGGVMTVVFDIVGTASLYIGAIISIWGVFQMILAFRREDSEGIGKQITTVVVGAVLVTFKVGILPALRKSLGI
jgi:asparagine N-glycosylation enzyme membrane subunit Stt3